MRENNIAAKTTRESNLTNKSNVFFGCDFFGKMDSRMK